MCTQTQMHSQLSRHFRSPKGQLSDSSRHGVYYRRQRPDSMLLVRSFQTENTQWHFLAFPGIRIWGGRFT